MSRIELGVCRGKTCVVQGWFLPLPAQLVTPVSLGSDDELVYWGFH